MSTPDRVSRHSLTHLLSFFLSLFLQLSFSLPASSRSFGSGGFATIAHHVLLIRLASGRVSRAGEARPEAPGGARSGGRRKTEKCTKKRGDGVIYKPTGTTQSEATPGDEGCPHFEPPFALFPSFVVMQPSLLPSDPLTSTRAALHRDARCMLHRRMRDVCARYAMRAYERK